MSHRLHGALFTNETDLLAAARECRKLDLDLVEAYTPYPIHGIEDVMGIRRTRLPWICLAGGVLGLAGGLWLQYWSSSVSWPINVGGKPFDSLPAFVPVAFELMVLLAGLMTALGLWLRSGLWPGRKPRRTPPRVTDDRFALLVRPKNNALDPFKIRETLEAAGAIECWEEED